MPGSEFKAFKLLRDPCTLLLWCWTIPLWGKPPSRTYSTIWMKKSKSLRMYASWGTSQLLIQQKNIWQPLAHDDLRTRNKWVWFQSLQQCLPNGQYLQKESNQTFVMQQSILNIKSKSLGSTLDTELWLRTKWKMHHYFTFFSQGD